MPLDSLIDPKHPNLREIKSVKQLPTDKGFIATIGSPRCGHCVHEFKEVLNPLCKDESFTKKGNQCFGIDGGTQDGQKFAQDIGLNLQGFPTTVMCAPNKENKNMDCVPLVGAYPRADLEDVAKKLKMM